MPNKPQTKNTKNNSATSRMTRSQSQSQLSEIISSQESPAITTNKRKKADSSPTKSPTAKKPTQTNMSTPTLNEIAELLDKQTKSLKEEFKNEMKAASDELKVSFQDELNKLHKKVESIETNVSSQITNLRTEIDNCVNRLNNTEDDFIRIGRLNELKINGIAHTNNENLTKIFGSIAKVIGYDVTNPLNMPEIVRMQKRNNQVNDFIPLPSIILKFVAAHIRNNFYGKYLAKISKEPILSEHIGMTQGSTIRVGEMLTAQNQMIFTEAIKLKRDKKLLKVNTMDGLVRVKCHQSNRYETVKSKRELEMLVASSASKTTPSPDTIGTISNTPNQNLTAMEQ